MQYAHRPIDAKGSAQLLLVKVEPVLRTDLYNALQAVFGKPFADGILQCRLAFHRPDKVECLLNGHVRWLPHMNALINRNSPTHGL